MPLIRFPTVKGLVYTIDLSKIADRENPRTVEAPIDGQVVEKTIIDWGDGNLTEVPLTGASFPTHQYADGAGDVFRVVIRSAGGHIPKISFNTDQANTAPSKNLSYAVISVDHFAGWQGNSSPSICYGLRSCYNAQYVDPRYTGLSKWSSLTYSCGALSSLGKAMAIEQPIESFCFDFVTQANNAAGLFSYCIKITGNLWPTILNTVKNSVNFSYLFFSCEKLGGEPFVFWKSDGSLDTDTYPNLQYGISAYTGCTSGLRAQVPTAYGGTLTVS